MEEQTATVTRESLLADAEAHDSKGDFNIQEVVKPSEQAAEESASSSGNPEAVKPEPEAVSPSDSSLKDGESPKESKPQSKWAANEERKSKTWKELNSEKESLKKERDAFIAEQEKLRVEREEFLKAKAKPDAEFRDEKGHSVKDYEDAARKFSEEGDEELARMARDKVAKLQSLEQQSRQKRAMEEFNRKWSDNYIKLSEKDPDLKDENSETYKSVFALLQKHPLLTQSPDGLNYAYEAVSISKKGKNYEAAQAELAKLKDELGKYQKKLAIGGGVPTQTLEGEKPFDKLSQDEQRKRLMASAEEFDRNMR